MRALLLIPIFGLLLTMGCRAPAVVRTVVKDSIIVRETVRVDTVYVQGDTVRLAGVVIECDSTTNKPKPFTVRKHRGSATVTAAVSAKGVLSVTGECDSLQVVLKEKDREITRLHTRDETQIQTIYKTRTIDVVCRWFTGIVLVLIAAITGLKLKGWI